MKHNLNIQAKYFNYILYGTKRIELRLYDEKKSLINVDDNIQFTNNKNDQILATKVISLHRYPNFNELFNDFDIEILADKSMTKKELIDTLNTFYSIDDQKKYGVVGIEIVLI